MSRGERHFGPYRLVQQIAVGGMAEIHLAKTQGIAGFEKYVALKMIHPNFSQDSHFIQMLIDEAKITVQLQHVNIAQTFDLGRVGETFYITMEYVDGADLYRLLRRSAELDRMFPIPLAAFIGKEVASGLDYAHRKRDHNGQPLGIVHRDVSPQNVLISYAGEVKLVDFGIAKATMRARQTQAGVIKGKYYYMSPEQAWGEPLDHRTDIFSAGILLYETLTGQMLYLEEDLHKLLDMVRRADIPPPSTLRPDIPPELDAIAMRALAKEPQDRYSHAAEMAQELERFLHAHAPVFTANKVSSWIAELIGQPVLPTPHHEVVVERKPEPEGKRGETRRFTRDQLVLARSDFTDENSIIFDAFEDEASGGGSRGGAVDENSTFDARVPPGTDDDVDSLPAAPREPARGAALARSEAQSGVLQDFTEQPTRRRSPDLPGVSPSGGRASDSAGARPRPPTSPAAPRARDQETRLLVDAAPMASSRRAGGDEAAARGPDPRRGAASPSARADGLPSPHRSADDRSAGPDDATLISEAPSWWSGTGDATEVAQAPFGLEGLSPPPGEVDQDAPTVLKQQPVVVPPPSPSRWERAPALSARVPQPAVSELRPPRGSRRTPAGGAPALASGQAEAAVSRQTDDQPLTSVLASLLAPGETQAGVEVALSPVTPLAPAERDPSSHSSTRIPQQGGATSSHSSTRIPQQGAAPSSHSSTRIPQQGGAAPSSHSPEPLARGSGVAGGPPPPYPPHPEAGFPGMPMDGAQQYPGGMVGAYEREAIPDHYKVGRSKQPAPWLIGLLALILAASVAAVLLAIYGTSEDEAGKDAVLQLISIPPGATVTVDGKSEATPTPAVIRGAPGTRFRIAFDLPGYQHEEQEFLVPEQGGTHQVIARLDPMVVKLSVESVPPGAEVFIRGNSVGRTPLELPGLDPQSTSSIELRLRGYRPVRQQLDWSDKAEQRLVIEMTQ